MQYLSPVTATNRHSQSVYQRNWQYFR